jgi:hypothetical protein
MAERKILVVETEDEANGNATDTLLAEGFTPAAPERLEVLVYDANAVDGPSDMQLNKWIVQGRK